MTVNLVKGSRLENVTFHALLSVCGMEPRATANKGPYCEQHMI